MERTQNEAPTAVFGSDSAIDLVKAKKVPDTGIAVVSNEQGALIGSRRTATADHVHGPADKIAAAQIPTESQSIITVNGEEDEELVKVQNEAEEDASAAELRQTLYIDQG